MAVEERDKKMFGNDCPSGSNDPSRGKLGLLIDLDAEMGVSLFSGKSEPQKLDSEDEFQAKQNTKTISESDQSENIRKRARGDKGRVMMKKNPGDDAEAILKANRAKLKQKIQELLDSDDESPQKWKPFKCPHCPAHYLSSQSLSKHKRTKHK